jgi:biopolymer transport protein ExbD
MKRNKRPQRVIELQIVPLIDICFLLLVFFMISAKSAPSEKDLNLGIPGAVSQQEIVDLPDEQKIEIQHDQSIWMNEMKVVESGDCDMERLEKQLRQLYQSSQLCRSELLVTLVIADQVPHQRLIDVVDRCTKIGIKGVTLDDPEINQGEG